MSDPGKPVPNDDASCHCLLDPETVPVGFLVLGYSDGTPAGACVACDPSCPHHGPVVRAIRRSSLGSLGIGRQQ